MKDVPAQLGRLVAWSNASISAADIGRGRLAVRADVGQSCSVAKVLKGGCIRTSLEAQNR